MFQNSPLPTFHTSESIFHHAFYSLVLHYFSIKISYAGTQIPQVHWQKCTSGGLEMQTLGQQDSLFFIKTQTKHHQQEIAKRQASSKYNPSNHSCSFRHSQVTTTLQRQSAFSQTLVHPFQGVFLIIRNLHSTCWYFWDPRSCSFHLLRHWQQSTQKRNTKFTVYLPKPKVSTINCIPALSWSAAGTAVEKVPFLWFSAICYQTANKCPVFLWYTVK